MAKYWNLAFLIVVCGASVEAKNISTEVYRKDLPRVCNKTYFIENYVDQGKYLGKSTLLSMAKQCPAAMCEGTQLLMVTYALSLNKGYFFIIKSKNDLLEQNNNDCWGYALEVFNDTSSYTMYFNFKEKNPRIESLIKVSPGATYSFFLTPIPSGTRQEQIFIKVPTKCENKVLDYIYDKETQNDYWFQGCISRPGLKEKHRVSTKLCGMVKDWHNETLFNATMHQLNVTNCALKVWETETKLLSYAEQINISRWAITVVVFAKLLFSI